MSCVILLSLVMSEFSWIRQLSHWELRPRGRHSVESAVHFWWTYKGFSTKIRIARMDLESNDCVSMYSRLWGALSLHTRDKQLMSRIIAILSEKRRTYLEDNEYEDFTLLRLNAHGITDTALHESSEVHWTIWAMFSRWIDCVRELVLTPSQIKSNVL